MRRGLLSELFTGVVAKKLTLVETVTHLSNQHEFQGTKPFRSLFGCEDQRQIPTRFIWLSSEQEGITENGFVSWSNVRKGQPRAPEYHLYYSGNAVTESMRVGDMMFLARESSGAILIVISPGDSNLTYQLKWLFGLEEQANFEDETFRDLTRDSCPTLDYAARYILDELGVHPEEKDAEILDSILAPLNKQFPKTAIFSELARSSLVDIDNYKSSDETLMALLEREEALFRRLERVMVADRLHSGFIAGENADVDGFLAFSLTVQNRRKSRAGFSLENHLDWIFKKQNLIFERNALTEGKSKPDFLFPGSAEYHNPSFSAKNLIMLGSKSTLKDRWRQVLAEAERIEKKHLLTLEPAISVHQTNEMRSRNLQLVIPKSLHVTFQASQREWLMTLDDFIELVQAQQLNSAASR